MNVPKATYEIIYNGKNITGNILPYVKSFTYSDKSNGEADEIEILLEDSEKLWQNNWYPSKGDTVSAKIFFLGNVLDCGAFTVDELSGEGSTDGDNFTIKGIAAGINKKIRSKHSYAHENKTLREIVNTIAAKYGFTVKGQISNISIGRETQHRETDLKFLRRLADGYGYTFSIRDKQLIFTDIFSIENKQDALTISRADIISYSITDKTANTFKSAKNTYHNAKKKQVISYEEDESNEAYTNVKEDSLDLHFRTENKQQSEIKTKVALYKANSRQQSGSIEMPGNILVMAGNNCTMEGLGKFSGKYYIDSTTHEVSSDGGYTTSAEIKRVGLIEK